MYNRVKFHTGVQKVMQPYGETIYFTVSAGSGRRSVFHTSGQINHVLEHPLQC
jgi:hypothetical protein